jgi:N-acyl amino acid synthase of PEP-CTERM/exosortase system
MFEPKSFLTSFIELYKERSFLQAYDDTFALVRADNDALHEKVFQLRYEVYCEENNFEKPPFIDEKLEYDSFDDRAVHYLLMHKPSGEAAGTLRVVLPNDEYPSDSFLIQKHCEHPLVRHETKILALCEVSRFCTSKKFRKRDKDGRILSSYSEQDNDSGYKRLIPYMPAALLQGAFETALSARILDCVWMVDPCHLTSLERIGFPFQTLGPHVKYHGGAQPIIFNIKNVLDTMRRKNRHCWDVVSDLGRLQKIADDLHQNDWHDKLIDEEGWEAFYEQGVEGADFRDLR